MHVNSTATGGGVAEMLPPLLGYTAGFGIDTQWHVLNGNPEFFAITKRVHNRIHGHPGDSGVLGSAERRAYDRVLAGAAADLRASFRPGDVAVLHDPQTLGLAPLLRLAGVHPVWRCHIGSDSVNPVTDEAWHFLAPYLDTVAAVVFSRAGYRPAGIPRERSYVITPSIDPLSVKNCHISTADVAHILSYVGLLAGKAEEPPKYLRRNGSAALLTSRADVIQEGPPPPDQPLVLQVSRWDSLKDMVGVMHGFAEYVVPNGPGHLILAGPTVSGVSDDPEGAAAFETCRQSWLALPLADRRRIHLACLPMVDVDENALIVNALQRRASVVTQKSLAEGFGLTVVEAMWKSRPVVASAIGGILDQITDQRDGLLLPDPTDLATFGGLVRRLLDEPDLAESIGREAGLRSAEFLPDKHLTAWANLLTHLQSL